MNFSKMGRTHLENLEPAQNYRRKKGEIKQGPYCGPTNIKHHLIKIKSSGLAGARSMCTPALSVVVTVCPAKFNIQTFLQSGNRANYVF
jgi:hypothetical protein